MDRKAPLGFAFLGVFGVALVMVIPGPLEVKLAALGIIAPLTGVAGGIARMSEPGERHRPPERFTPPQRPWRGPPGPLQ